MAGVKGKSGRPKGSRTITVFDRDKLKGQVVEKINAMFRDFDMMESREKISFLKYVSAYCLPAMPITEDNEGKSNEIKIEVIQPNKGGVKINDIEL